MSYYDLLGVPPEASSDQIRSAYRTLVQLFHPDRLSHLKAESRLFAEERLKALNQAYEVLGDPAKRAKYDSAESARAAQHAPAPPPARREPAPQRPPAYSPQNPYTAQQPGSAARGGASQQDWSAYKRQAALDNRRRLAQLDAEIAELARGVKQLEADRSRTQQRLNRQQTRTRRYFWIITTITGLGTWGLLLIAAGIFSQPPAVLDVTAQRVAFFLLVSLYEYTSALTIVFASRVPSLPVSFAGTLWLSLRGLVAGWLVGLAGWAVWAALFGAFTSLASLGVLALVFPLAHIAFALVALGHLPRLVRDQQRQFEQSFLPMLQAYQHQLTQLRARKTVIESETT